jgi:Flp pilus assembly protein CpaB
MTNRSLFPLSIRPSLLVAIVAIPIGVIGAAYLFWHEARTNVSVPVPKQDLPAYHPIRPGDLVQKTYAARNLPANTFRKPQEIAGRYTLTQIPKQKPLMEKQLSSKVNPIYLANTVVVGIPATPATTLGGSLQAGDIVDITFASATAKAVSSSSPIVFQNILVLDVKPASQANSPSVVVIALPSKRQKEFASYSISATLLVSRKL